MIRRKSSPGSSLLLVLTLALANHITLPQARGQAVSATLLGMVTDASGGVVPGATVSVTEVNTGQTRSTTTTVAGVYSVPYLSPGRYRVEISAPGFKTFVREPVEVTVASSVRVDAVLEVGSIAETVKVTAESPLLQTDRAEVAQTFSTETVRELPLAERTPQALVALVAGVGPPSTNIRSLEGPQGTTSFRVHGQPVSSNNTQVDGVDSNDPIVNQTIYIPPPESVQEVYVTTSNYNAEFGRAGGAVVNIVTRGGTNEIHGSLFEFHRNTHLTARNFFSHAPTPKPSIVRNEFGASIGGPIVKDKTFYFGSYQGRRLRTSTRTVTTVPVEAWRSGDFGGTPGLNLFDPATGNPDGTGRLPFPGNRVPGDRFHSVSKKLLPLIPNANAPGLTSNLIVNVPFAYDGGAYDGRVDHNFTAGTKLFAKFNLSRFSLTQKAALGDVVGDGNVASPYTVTGILDLTHGFSPTLLTELRGGFNRYYARVTGINIERPLSKELGIQNPNPDPISSQGLARIQIAGMAAMGTQVFYPLINVDNIFNFVNTWNKVISRHTMKWGIDARRIRIDRFQPQGLNLGPRGRFDFNPGTTALRGGPPLGPYGTFGNSFAAFLIGATDQTSRTYMTVTPTNRTTHVFTFFHDSFQVTRRLTLDLGLRHELYTTVKPRYAAGASNYDPYTNTILVAGVGEVNMSTGVRVDLNNFQPRFGISYRFREKTVVRLGYGISNFTATWGFTGGTLSTQFPVIYNVQEGVAGDYRVDGSFSTLPVVRFVPIPQDGKINPAPDQAFFHIPYKNPMPFVHSYSFVIQRELPWGVVWDVGYVGALGRRLPYGLALNTAPPGTGAAGRVLYQRFGRTANTIERGYGVTNNYNSLETNLRKKMSGGLMFTVAYTYSKAMGFGGDEAGGGQTGFMNNFNIHWHYAPLNYDRTHMLVASHLYELPIGQGRRWLNRKGLWPSIVGNWQLNGIFSWYTGTPFTVVADSTPCNCPGNSITADALKPCRILGGIGPGEKWFDVTAFGQPGPNRWGTAGRNTVRGPGMRTYNFSIFKHFPIPERAKVEFRAEFFNLTNTPTFPNPDSNFNSGTFGEIRSASGERVIQLALRLLF